MSIIPPLEFYKLNSYDEIETILSDALSDTNTPELKIIPYDENSAPSTMEQNLKAHNSETSTLTKIDLLSVGASPTPHSEGRLKRFLISFGMEDEDAIYSLGKADSAPKFSEKNMFSAKIISDDLVLDDSILYSTNHLWVSTIPKSGALDFITDIGSITKNQIKELPSYHGGETFFESVIFKKIFQDLIVAAVESKCIYISIFNSNSNYIVTSSNGLYSFDSFNVFANDRMFFKFAEYIKGIKVDIIDDIPFDSTMIDASTQTSRAPGQEEKTNEKFQIDFEIDDRHINIIAQMDTLLKTISFELVYKPINNICIFESFSIPTAQELYSKFTVLSYEKKIIKDFLLSELARELPKGGVPLFVSDDFAVANWFPFSIPFTSDWRSSSKVSQADILVCSFTTDDALRTLNRIIMSGKPVILVTPGVGTLDMIKSIRGISELNIDSQFTSTHHFSTAPTTCPYCSKTRILNSPKLISTFMESPVFIPDSTEFIARNPAGCDKCTFGMTEVLTFAESLFLSQNLIETLTTSPGYRDDEIIQKHSDSYFSSTKNKLKAVLNKTVDPDDL